MQNGINLAEMNALLLQKIAELTLYVIELENKIKTQNKMKSYAFFTLVFILFTGITFSQNEGSINDSISHNNMDFQGNHLLKNNQFEIELNYLSISGYYKKKIGNRFSIGTSFGIGQSAIMLISKPVSYPDFLGDYIHLNLLFTYHPSSYINIEGGVKGAYAGFGKNDLCEESGTLYTSPFFSILFGLKHFKLGTRIGGTRIRICNSNSNFVLLYNPVFFRIIF